MHWPTLVYILFVIFFGYFIVLTLYYLVLLIIGLIEGKKRALQDRLENYPILSSSGFTIPVSVILPAHNEEDWILDALKSILNQSYPEFEVIIVNDGSTDKTFSLLDGFLKLKSVDLHYTDHFQSGKIHEVFKSETYSNVTVISKTGGFKKAGAVNAGLNFVRYQYVCVIDADTVLEPDALLKVMAHVQKDPENIVGIGSYFGLVNGFKIKDGQVVERNFTPNMLIAYQNLEYIRTFIGARIAWSKYNAMPCVSGGFGIWRKDILLKLGGYATDFSSEDIELTFRAHDYLVKNKISGYKIMMLPYYIGWTEGPGNIISLLQQRNRWQRVINETISRYKHMILNPRYKTFAFFTLPYYLIYEVLDVFVEIISIVTLLASCLAGLLQVEAFLSFLILISISQTAISLLSIFSFIRHQNLLKMKDVAFLVILSFFELFLYRWIIWIAKLWGTYNYLRGVRVYEQYTRIPRR
ncbi:MAG: glycosyltransferase [Planctomycetota bacterium]